MLTPIEVNTLPAHLTSNSPALAAFLAPSEREAMRADRLFYNRGEVNKLFKGIYGRVIAEAKPKNKTPVFLTVEPHYHPAPDGRFYFWLDVPKAIKLDPDATPYWRFAGSEYEIIPRETSGIPTTDEQAGQLCLKIVREAGLLAPEAAPAAHHAPARPLTRGQRKRERQRNPGTAPQALADQLNQLRLK